MRAHSRWSNHLLIRKASLLFAAGLIACIVSSASAQAPAVAQTKFEREISKVDFGIGAIGQFNGQVSGTIPNNGAFDANQNLTEKASNTVGVFGQIRYAAKPYFGLEFNATQSRYTENFNQAPTQIQATVNEFSFGYLVTPKVRFFGLQPYASLDAGSNAFPSHVRWRRRRSQAMARHLRLQPLAYRLSSVRSHFGARVAFRQAFFKAPRLPAKLPHHQPAHQHQSNRTSCFTSASNASHEPSTRRR